MSKVSLQGNISGSGTLTIAAPNTNSNYTLTLPAESGTLITSGGAIDVSASAPADSLVLDSSGNVGIGTSSPGHKLQINGTSSLFDNIGGQFDLLIGDGSVRYWGIRTPAGAGTLQIRNHTGNSTIATFDTSGNLGLGVTPSAWDTAYGSKAIQIGPVGSLSSLQASTTNNQTFLTSNAYRASTGWKYLYSDAVSQYQQYAGTHRWNIAPSGTAGNAITFTQAMTLHASGGLSVGNTTDLGAKTVNIGITAATTNTLVGRVNFQGYTTTYGAGVASYIPSGAPGIDWQDLRFYTSQGPSAINVERARIDSGGNLLVGTTSASGTITIGSADATGTGLYVNLTTSAHYLQRFAVNSSIVGTITTNGTTTAYNTSSDYRLKNTIAPMTGALAKVSLLKPCTYKWNADGSDGEGFIAHELAEVCPQAVTGEKDAVDAEGKPVYQGVDTSFLVATLTAAIQELKAELDSVKAELAVIKGA